MKQKTNSLVPSPNAFGFARLSWPMLAMLGQLLLGVSLFASNLKAPSGLSATATSSSQITVKWTDNSQNELGTKIQRATSSAGPWAQVGSVGVNVLSYADAGLLAATTYYYRAEAYDGSGASAFSAVASAMTRADTTAPSTPAGLSAVAASASQVNLSWSASTDTGGSGLAGYRVYRSGVLLGTTTSTAYSNSGLGSGVQYCYTVSAYDKAGNASGQSAQVCATTKTASDLTAPSVPTAVTASAASSSQITVSWSPSTDTGGSGLAGYRVYRSGVLLGTTSSTVYYNTGLSAGAQYCYTVSAYDNAGNASGQSAQSCATTGNASDLTAPSVPSGVTTLVVSSSQINLGWNPSSDTGGSGLAGYRVYRGGVLLATTSSTAYSNTGLAAGTRYCYTVAAYDNAGNASGQSLQVCNTTSTVTSTDTTPPSVTLTSPASGATVSATISLTASASDNVGVTRVEFYVDGVLIGSDSAASYSFSYNTASTSNGTHMVGSKAYDAAGNWSTSANVNVTVSNAASVAAGCLASAQFGGPMANWDAAFPTSTHMDRSGNFIVAGFFRNTVNLGGGSVASYGNEDIFVAKYNSAGAYVWGRTLGSTSSDAVYGMALDSLDNIVVAGTFNGSINFGGTVLTSAGSSDIFVAKYSTSGSVLWAKRFGGTATEKCQGVALDTADNIFITGGYGFYGSSVDFGGGLLPLSGGQASFQYDTYVAKLSSSGTYLWSHGYGGVSYDFGNGIAVDANGDVAIVGDFQGTVNFGGSTLVSVGGYDVFVAKYSGSTGAHLWSRSGGGVSNDSGKGVAFDPSGNVLITGEFNGTANFGGLPLVSANLNNGVVVAKYSSSGTPLWSRGFSGLTSWGVGSGRAITADKVGNIYVAGAVTGAVQVDGVLLGNGTLDVMLLKLAPADGSRIWANFYGGNSDDFAAAVSTTPDGNLVVAGTFTTSIDFGCGLHQTTGGQDGFVVKMTQ